MSGVNKPVTTETNKTVTTDTSRSTNMVETNSYVIKKEANHERDRKLIPMNKLNDVPENDC